MTILSDRVRTSLEALTRTPVDRRALDQWPGWGALAPALDQRTPESFPEIRELLETHLSEAELHGGSEVCHTSFYTPHWLASLAHKLVAQLGVTSGRFLDLGTGTGRFLDAGPEGVQWTAIEKDPLSARIASLRHPEATIHACDLSQAVMAEGAFHAVVGNIPFSSGSAWSNSLRYHGNVTGLFMTAAVRSLAPEGVCVMITPCGVIDRWSTFGLDQAEVLGAIRLPSGTFEATRACADLVVIQRGSGSNCAVQSDYAKREDSLSINAMWQEHPEWVAGRIQQTSSLQMPMEVVSSDIRGDVERAYQALSEHLKPYTRSDMSGINLDDVMITNDQGEPVGSYVWRGQELFRVEFDGSLSPARVTKELRQLLELRDLVSHLMELESEVGNDAELEDIRRRTHDTWASYVATYGPLNRGVLHEGSIDAETGLAKMSWRRPALGGFRKDPRSALVMSIENYDMETETASAAPILLHRVNVPPERATSAASLRDALSISLAEAGSIDLARAAELVGMSEAEARAICERDDLTFTDPVSNRDVLSRDYLCGHIPTKLAAARAAGLERHVRALEAINPPPLGAVDLEVRLGVSWIGARDIETFAREVLGCSSGNVTYDSITGSWEADLYGGSAQARATYATNRVDLPRLLGCALNSRTPVVYDEIYDETTFSYRRVKNASETLAAIDRLSALDDAFRLWIWSDESRTERILADYNAQFGGVVARTHDGSHLRFDGMSPDVSLWKHQRDMVDFAMSVPRALCAHTVGAGKTRTAIAAAMTARAFGQARRPMMIVPGHLLDQVARECQQTYPSASILIATREDLSGNARRLFAARCLSSDPDLIIMSHESFTSLPLSASVESELLAERKSHLANRATHAEMPTYGKTPKQIARMMESFDAKMASLRSGVNDPATVRFDQLGVDYLIVDEAHLFRRHPAAATRVEGFSLGASQRAADLSLKLDYLAACHPGKAHALLMTGTPFVNSLAETFVWLHYLMPERLERMGISTFDAFAATFVEYVTRAEVASDGSGFKLQTRPAAITNAPELMGLFDEVAHFVTSEELDLPRPSVNYHEVISQCTQSQRAFMNEIVDRSARLAQGKGRDGDNALVICSDGRKIALDPQLVGLSRSKSPKLIRGAKVVATISRKNPGSLQLVCLDMGTPKPGDSSSYGRLRQLLIAQGVPADRIRFIHEATTDKQRAALFAACRQGEVSVLLGSTSKVGTGTNIQQRLRAIHHFDSAWNPAGMEQREGRGVRFGNTHETVDIYRHITEGTFDAFMWQALVRKASFVSSLLMQSNRTQRARRIEDIGDIVLDYSHVLAAASGNPLLGRRAELAAEVRRLRTLAAMHQGRVTKISGQQEGEERRVLTLTRQIDDLTKIVQAPPTRQDCRSLAQQAAPLLHRSAMLRWASVETNSYELSDAQAKGEYVMRHRDCSGGLLITLDKRTLRSGVSTIEDAMVKAINNALDDLRQRIDTAIERRSAAQQQARELSVALSEMAFEHEDALRDAISQLAHIDREIAAATEDLAA